MQSKNGVAGPGRGQAGVPRLGGDEGSRAVDVRIAMPDGHAEAWVARPENTERALPGVVLFMDAFGLRPQIREMAQRIADWGYVVMAPNVFHRSGAVDEIAPTADLREPEERDRFLGQAVPRMNDLTPELSRADTDRYLEALAELPGVADGAPVGVIGYCMGARLALRAAGDHPDRVGAVGGFHGGGLVTEDPDSPHRSLASTRAAVLLRHADDDPSMPAEGMETITSLAEDSGVELDQCVYPGAPHGYTRWPTPRCTSPPLRSSTSPSSASTWGAT